MTRWMTLRQVAEYLQLSQAKVYKLARTGHIPCSKIGQQWRFDREEVDQWVSAQRRTGASVQRQERGG